MPINNPGEQSRQAARLACHRTQHSSPRPTAIRRIFIVTALSLALPSHAYSDDARWCSTHADLTMRKRNGLCKQRLQRPGPINFVDPPPPSVICVMTFLKLIIFSNLTGGFSWSGSILPVAADGKYQMPSISPRRCPSGGRRNS